MKKKMMLLTVTSVAMLTVTTAFAADTAGTFMNKGRPGFAGEKGQSGMKNPLESLVTDSVIDQATYDAISAYMKAERSNIEEQVKTERKDMFVVMLDNGVITQSQYDAIKAFMPETQEQRDQNERKDPFSELVSSGVISQSTYDTIMNYWESKKKDLPERPELSETMTLPDRSTKTKPSDRTGEPGERTDMLSELIENNLISQSEYDAIKAAMPENTSIFDQLLRNAIIDQTTYDAMKAFIESQKESMTPLTDMQGTRKDMFSELLNDGVITQTQYDAIKAAMTKGL